MSLNVSKVNISRQDKKKITQNSCNSSAQLISNNVLSKNDNLISKNINENKKIEDNNNQEDISLRSNKGKETQENLLQTQDKSRRKSIVKQNNGSSISKL